MASSGGPLLNMTPALADPGPQPLWQRLSAGDNKFLALVHECRADVLVSSDGDLLLNPWRGVRVLRPAELPDRLGAAR